MESVTKHYKIILTSKDRETREVRYVPAYHSVDLLKQRIAEIFQITVADIKLTWIDSEEDHIAVLNQDDFAIALAQPSELKTFYVTSNSAQSNTEQPEVSFNPHFVVCDVCQNQITAYRYKCLECEDYDLCGTCEGAGHHSEHIFLRLPSSDFPLSRYDRRVLHSAARDLKKSAQKKASRGEKDFRKHHHGGKWERKCHRDSRGASETSGCPFGSEFNVENIPRLGRQHLGSLLQTLNINPQDRPLDGNLVSDVIRNAVEAVFGAGRQETGQNATNGTTPETTNTSPNAPPPQETTSKAGGMPMPTPQTVSNTQGFAATTTTTTNNGPQTIPNLPGFTTTNTGLQTDSHKVNSQPEKTTEMDWTFVQNQDPILIPATPTSTPSSVASATELLYPTIPTTNSSAPPSNISAPPPGFLLHPDPIIAHGLAQLYEMGFSNEDDILTRLLQKYKGNVAEVVKTIVSMG